jgi:hypothetical protein
MVLPTVFALTKSILPISQGANALPFCRVHILQTTPKYTNNNDSVFRAVKGAAFVVGHLTASQLTLSGTQLEQGGSKTYSKGVTCKFSSTPTHSQPKWVLPALQAQVTGRCGHHLLNHSHRSVGGSVGSALFYARQCHRQFVDVTTHHSRTKE